MKKEIDLSKMETVIGPETHFQGDIKTKGFVRLDGNIQGNVQAEGVIIGDKARVTGNISGTNVFIGGHVTGNVVTTQSLELQHTGRLTGDIHTPHLSIAEGGFFEGRCTMTPNTSQEA